MTSATRCRGNYSEYVASKAEAVARQWAAYEKQQKEIARQVGPGFTLAAQLMQAHCHVSPCIQCCN